MSDFFLPPVISNGMIIQRGFSFPILTSKKITVTFLNKTYEAQPKDGKFLITLDPSEAGGPYEMDITSEEGLIKITDIYIGDVWLCAGQSNMEMQMSRLRDDFGEEWDFIKKECETELLIRQFKPPQEWDFSGPRDEITGGSWLKPSDQTLHEFTATPWFFARFLHEKYKIPIGLVITPWGGTPVESWMSEESLLGYPEKIKLGRLYADTAKREEAVKISCAAIGEWEKNLLNNDSGITKQWEKPETDISSWNEMILPGSFYAASDKKEELDKFCGVIWLSKDFEVSSDFASHNAKVWLGTIIDSDKVYVNGAEIGNTGYRYPPRKYVPQGLIKPGKNRIVIRVVCNCGDGGITADKPFRVFTDNESVELTGAWKYKIGAKTQTRPEEYFFQRFPTGNYNAIIAPVLKYPFKGVIWYQGESNESNPNEYEELFKLMITGWRKNSREDLPFLFVQLPVFTPVSDNNEQSRWAILREAQTSALSLPNTGMAAALEFGEWNDIHPINKKDVAFRLFLAAEKTVFGVNNTSPGPMVKDYKLKNSGQIIHIYFNNCQDGLITKENLPCVTVVGNDGAVNIPAIIEGKDCISIDISSVKNPQKILYAWADNPRYRNLFNSEGLPVIPFKITIK
ncbi:MAG: hypothetical protein FWB95_01885 [Treponema sp.]|nr:hypothetical protein [Treponema sp.]